MSCQHQYCKCLIWTYKQNKTKQNKTHTQKKKKNQQKNKKQNKTKQQNKIFDEKKLFVPAGQGVHVPALTWLLYVPMVREGEYR
jgi:hypothetical protein